MRWLTCFASIAWLILTGRGYDVVRDYSGLKFFDGWDFFGGFDNLTLGDVVWLNEADAFAQRLAYVNEANRAVIRVDNTTNVPYNQKRNSVRITTKDAYSVGSLWMIDVVHLPWGCSVWPAFWTKGDLWPDDGEIDIIEGINLMPNNQYSMHTLPGCMHSTPPNQSGRTGEVNCSTEAGCTVGELSPNSFLSGFAESGGGVWATQFDVAGIFIWFWSRSNIPSSINQANSTSSIDTSSWGPPSASYPSVSCNTTEFFTPQNLVLDITLCGKWAGLGETYNATCGSSGPTGLCYNDNVVGPGSPRYNNAYFDISYVRAYTTGSSIPVSTSTPTVAAVTTGATHTAVSSALGKGSGGSTCGIALLAVMSGVVWW